MIKKEYFENQQKEFNELLNTAEKIFKPFKYKRKKSTQNTNPNHIIGMINEKGHSLCQKTCQKQNKKNNYIPDPINSFNIKKIT
ncbi:MAG: hypothetical protein FWH37_07465 [Candidatus Bathyarchaeota archaeon]|nr:hypothetical protein [Candidatus Termiticorpusculum sp.]